MPTTTTTPTHDVALRAGAAKGEWQDVGTPGAFHYFEGSRWVVDRHEDLPTSRDVEVYIRGTQDPDGMVEREIVVHQLHADGPITPRQARQVARTLIAAADEVGELTD